MNNERIKFHIKALNVSTVLMLIICMFYLFTTRYDTPLYFYINFQRYSEQEGCIEMMNTIKSRVSEDEFKELITWSIVQHADLNAYTIGRYMLANTKIEGVDTIVSLSSKYFEAIPKSFSWSVGYPITSNKLFKTTDEQVKLFNRGDNEKNK